MILLTLSVMPGKASADSDIISTIHVKVTTVDGAQAPPPRIAKRMAASVSTVGEHVLIGRKASEVADAKTSYERIIKEVFDRILVGYTVEDVNIKPGADAEITVQLAPWGEVVGEVELEVDYGSISPELAALIKTDMGDVEAKVNDVLIGLPIDAVDWAGGVSKTVIQDMLASRLPEFRTNLEVEAGQRTIVKLTLVPAGATIQDVHVSLRSHTLPNVLLSGVETVFEDESKNLVGLPVAFVERHRDYFTANLADAANQHPLTKSYGLALTTTIAPGPDTVVSVNAETTKYNIWLEGYLDMGRNERDNTSVRLHTGKYIGSRDEAYLETNFIPGSVAWKFAPGWAHRIGNSTYAGAKYDISDKAGILTLNQALGRDWSLRAERRPAEGKSEIGLRYRLHDYISAEYIYTNDTSWLRLVGHL